MIDLNSLKEISLTSEQKKILAIGAGVIVLLTLDICFVIIPLTKKSSVLKRQVVKLSTDINSVSKEVSLLDSKKEKIRILKAEKSAYEGKFPKEEELSSLMENLSKIAVDSKVDIIAVKPLKHNVPGKEIKLLRQAPIEILARGGYHQIGQFINSLERLDRFLEIKQITITWDGKSPRKHHLRLLVATYILRV